MKIQIVTYSNAMKRKPWLLLAGLCLLIITGCGNLYTGEETLFNPDRDTNMKEENVPIMVALDDPYYNILSRGVGKIDPEEEYFEGKMNPVDEEGNPIQDLKLKPRFFVYAFKRNNPYGFNITRKEDKEICLVDGSCGTQAEYADVYPDEMLEGHGKWAYYNGNGSFVNWLFTDKDKLYYSKQSPNAPYDFFAYHHDGAASGPMSRTTERISFPVTIDGSQDLMCGMASLSKEQLKLINSMTDEEEKQKIKEFHYSTYTGKRNIWPVFQLRHQMAYIRFNLVAGNAYGDPVRVHEVALETHTQGTFVVVSRDKNALGATFNENGERKFLAIRDVKDGSELTPERWDERFENQEYRLEYYSEEEKEANGGKERPDPYVAGEILVPPGNNTVLRMVLSNKDTFGEPELTDLPLKNEFGQGVGLEAGRTYNLNITVYGPKLISIEVEASPWKDGGDLDVDIEEN